MSLEYFYEMEYRFLSQTGEIEGYRYITTYEINIYEVEYEKEERHLIGKSTIDLILAGLAINEGYSLMDVVDMETHIFKIGEEILNFENSNINEDIMEFCNHGLWNNDLCLLTRIEISESHRGKGIGKKVIKDIYNRFSSSCGLFIVKPFPLQFEATLDSDKPSKWSNSMNLDSLEKDSKKASLKLKAFYQKVGFDEIEGYENLMFLNPESRNERMGQVVL